jgi:hypothetical protein
MKNKIEIAELLAKRLTKMYVLDQQLGLTQMDLMSDIFDILQEWELANEKGDS